MFRIGIDVGGTFTDFTLLNEEDGSVHFHKVASTPHDPSAAIEHGISELLQTYKIAPEDIGHIGHGTTVATNLIIERRGALTGLITTKGFRDVIEIGRQVRPHLFDYTVVKPPPLAERQHRIEVSERIAANGDVVTALDEREVGSSTRAREHVRGVLVGWVFHVIETRRQGSQAPVHTLRALSAMRVLRRHRVRVRTTARRSTEFGVPRCLEFA